MKINKLEIEDQLFIRRQDLDKATEIPSGVLDIHDHQLSYEEAETLLSGDYINYNLRYENLYIALFENLYKMDQHVVLDDFDFKAISSLSLLQMLDQLDYADKLILMDMIRNLGYKKEAFYILEDISEVRLIAKIMTRELYFPMIHFIDLGISICGGYDLSFPVYFKNKENFDQIIKYINREKLFVRNMRF